MAIKAPAKKAAPAKAAPAKVEEAKVEETAAVEAPSFDWDALDDATEATYTRGPITRDVEAETPNAVKVKLAQSYDAYKPDANPELAAQGKGVSAWFTQRFPNRAMLDQFVKFAKMYAKFRGWTFRNTVMPATADDNGTVVLRYTAKPAEVRKSK